ncbi:hypothetical protein V8G54_035639 [Vigna mungo]|uniref:Uncharacterized protein n=1 Tax=Vigna mungo TaxID=3915 RepID=A0AAQ3MFT3_VIGMU
MPPHHHHQPLCTRTHQIGALLLVTTTFFFTRLLSPCTLSTSVVHLSHPQLQWGQSQLSLKIYVYEPEEINGLNNLLHGRDGENTQVSSAIEATDAEEGGSGSVLCSIVC